PYPPTLRDTLGMVRTPALARRRRRAALTALAVVAAAACHKQAADSDEDKPAAAAVTCVPAQATTIEDAIEVTGVIAPPPRFDATVSSPIAGRVGQVAVEEGDHV